MNLRPSWIRELLFLGAAVGVGLLVGRLLLAGPAEVPPPTAHPTGQIARPNPAQIEGAEELWSDTAGAVRANSGEPPEGAAVFPDGTWLEPINGVEKAPVFPDHPGWTMSPVVRVHTEPTTGLQWYIHEAGEVSTVYNVQHEAGEKKWVEPGWVLGKPTKAQPIR